MPDQERTEEPTQRHREQARREGQVCRSQDVNATVVLVTFLLLWAAYLPRFRQEIESLFAHWLTSSGQLQVNPETAPALLNTALAGGAHIIALPLGMAALAGLIANLMQVGFGASLDVLAPRLDRVNPVAGLRRLFSGRALFETLRALLKAAIIGWTAWSFCKVLAPTLCLLTTQRADRVWEAMVALLMALAWRIALVCAFIAVIDYLYQRHQFQQNLRMTRQQVRDEHRQSEGDPMVRARMRQRQRHMSRQRMLTLVPKSDVVVTNPTHFAVALIYRDGQMRAPVVSAKGADAIAQRIKALAERHGVPVLERRDLARELYASVELGEEIPPALYEAVAHVIAYIFDLNESKTRKGRA